MTVEQRAALRARAKEVLEHNSRLGIRAPDFGAGKDWLNVARPLTWKNDLAGKLVLLDFWSYCCINCVHVLADLAFLEQKYAGEPLVVVGCHSAKFPNERELDHVRRAVLREGIAHPVVVDREFDVWTRFAVRAWPTLMLISPDGRILGQLSGEGQRAVLDVMIEQALELYGERGALDARPLPLRLEQMSETARELRFPGKVLADERTRRLFVADSGHDRILALDFDGAFLASYGAGERGFADGSATDARFHAPQGLALDGDELFVADTGNHAIRRIDVRTGDVTTLAGTGRQGYERSRRMPAARAELDSPWDLALRGRELWIAMAGSHQIWSLDLDAQTIGPVAGDGTEQRRDGAFASAAFAQPSGLALRGEQIYVADSESSSVRALDLERATVATLAGGAPDPRNLFEFGDQDGAGFGRRLQHALGVCVDAQADAEHALVYVADTYNHKLKLLDPDSAHVATYAGDGVAGHVDGEAEHARFFEPGGLSIAGGKLFVADTNNHALRVVDLEMHVVATLALREVPKPRG